MNRRDFFRFGKNLIFAGAGAGICGISGRENIFASDKNVSIADSSAIRAIYLPSGYIDNSSKIYELLSLFGKTNANGIVIDYKDSNIPKQEKFVSLVSRFKSAGAYTIARVVALQDSGFARKHSEIAIKTKSGEFWHSGRKEWKRYWLDPAAPLSCGYNIEIAKRAVDAGFDEVQFDYIRFPTDGSMKDIVYPVFRPENGDMASVMRNFFARINGELKTYSPDIVLGVDLFGEVLAYGKVGGIGQNLHDAARFFDVLCPMAYPSHYRCGEFGLKDPNTDPYTVYYRTLKGGLDRIGESKTIIRPWLQDFSITNIYGCGPKVFYGHEMVSAQIRAGRDLGINGFMLWNVNANFTKSVFSPK
jgi:hypothetical protein